MMTVALLLVSELRFINNEHYENFYNLINDYDIFISTYKKFKFFAEKITKKKKYFIL